MKEIIEKFEKAINEKVESIIYYPGGVTNDNYLINKKYMVRRKKDFFQPFYDGENEKDVENGISEHDISVPCLYFDPVDGIKITLFIEDGVSLVNEKLTKKDIIAIAIKIKELHSLKYHCEKDFNVFERIRYYREEAFCQKHPLEEKITKNVLKYYQGQTTYLCHNDLILGNIMKAKKKIYLMDFEYARNNLPYFDIFSFLSQNKIEGKERELFLDTYFNGKQPKNIKRIREDFSALISLLWYYWSLMMYKHTLDPKYSQMALENEELLSQVKIDE